MPTNVRFTVAPRRRSPSYVIMLIVALALSLLIIEMTDPSPMEVNSALTEVP